MPSIKDYNRKINSLKNTSKITRTMKMVSASKLRKAQATQKEAENYADELNQLIYRIDHNAEANKHPCLETKEDVNNVLFIIFTSDRGLCGGFNNNIIRYVEQEVQELEAEGQQVRISCCGKRGFNYFRFREYFQKHYEDITIKPNSLDARAMARELLSEFTGGVWDQVDLIYNEFISPLSQQPQKVPLLPLEAEALEADEIEQIDEDFICEPDIETLLNELIPTILDFRIYYALLENAAGEHGARMTAMDSATDNAQQLIMNNTLLRNRARQTAITTELTEIISGAEAL